LKGLQCTNQESLHPLWEMVQNPIHPFGIAKGDEEECEDHERKRQCGEELGGNIRQHTLKKVRRGLQGDEEVGPQCSAEGLPAAKDDDGEGNPTCPLNSIRSGPARLDHERKGRSSQSNQCPADQRVNITHDRYVYTPDEGCSGPFP